MYISVTTKLHFRIPSQTLQHFRIEKIFTSFYADSWKPTC